MPTFAARTSTSPLIAAGLAVVLGGAPIAAQGSIRWTSPNTRPTLTVRENASPSPGTYAWTLNFDGWSTADSATLANDNEATGVGVSAAIYAVRSTSSDFIRGGAGGEAEAAPWFPFAPDARVVPIFVPSGPGLIWSGFMAPIGGPVPDNDFGSLSFRVEMGTPIDAPTMLGLLASARVGAALADNLGRAVGTVYSHSVDRVRLAPILYYKFDRGTGDFDVNYAGVDGGALGVAQLDRPNGARFAPGRFGSALAAGTTCNTGFYGDLGGRVTVAWFMRGQPSATLSPVFELGGFGCFTGGTAGNRLRCVGWGGTPSLDSPVMPNGRWVHVALVIDGDHSEAKWFLDGQAAPAIPITGQVAIPASATQMLVGAGNGTTSRFHLDEFRLSAEAIDATTIAAWANASTAVAQAYSRACGANLQHQGRPALGQTIAVRAEASPGSLGVLCLGVGTTLAGLPLPIDLGLFNPNLGSCAWHCDLTASLPMPIPQGRIALLPFSIPNDVNLRGTSLHNQLYVLEPSLRARASNAHAVSIE